MIRRLAAASLALGMVTAASAQEAVTGIEFEKNSGISMKITSHYNDIPPSGMLPVRVEITNRTASPRSWDILITQTNPPRGGSSRLSTTIDAPARSERTFELLVPLLNQADAYRYSTLTASISGYGVRYPVASIYSGERADAPPITPESARRSTPISGSTSAQTSRNGAWSLPGRRSTCPGCPTTGGAWRALTTSSSRQTTGPRSPPSSDPRFPTGSCKEASFTWWAIPPPPACPHRAAMERDMSPTGLPPATWSGFCPPSWKKAVPPLLRWRGTPGHGSWSSWWADRRLPT